MTDRQIGAVMVLKVQAWGLMFVALGTALRNGLRADWGWMTAELLGWFILWVTYLSASHVLRGPRPKAVPVRSDAPRLDDDFEAIVKEIREDRP